MRTTKTSKNQRTRAKKILKEIPDSDDCDVPLQNGVVVVGPVTVAKPGDRLATIRRKIPNWSVS